jgi:hypothetical protein
MLMLKQNVTYVYRCARPVPYTSVPVVEQELRLLELEVIKNIGTRIGVPQLWVSKSLMDQPGFVLTTQQGSMMLSSCISIFCLYRRISSLSLIGSCVLTNRLLHLCGTR